MGNREIKIRKKDAIVVGIDFQDRLMPAMNENEALEKAVIKLFKGARILNVPIIITQQYTKGLGPTVPGVLESLTAPIGEDVPAAEFESIEKTSFSAMDEPAFAEALEKTGRRTVIITGIEAHVCVMQTVIDLLEKGYNVFVVNDCISSRNMVDNTFSQSRMADSGAIGTTFEAVLFELCGGSKQPGFKQISALVK